MHCNWVSELYSVTDGRIINSRKRCISCRLSRPHIILPERRLCCAKRVLFYKCLSVCQYVCVRVCLRKNWNIIGQKLMRLCMDMRYNIHRYVFFFKFDCFLYLDSYFTFFQTETFPNSWSNIIFSRRNMSCDDPKSGCISLTLKLTFDSDSHFSLSTRHLLCETYRCKNVKKTVFLRFLPRCMVCRCGLAMRILSVCLSVRPSVCLSHAWIVTKR